MSSYDLVDRVAKAICNAQHGEDCWDAMTEEVFDSYLVMARAAIEAMREPTKAMCDVADDQFDWGPSGYDDAPQGAAYSDRVWRAMIDAALTLPEPP